MANGDDNRFKEFETQDICGCGVPHGSGEHHHHHHHDHSHLEETGPKRTPLYDLHVELGAKIVEFAGYDMPVSYPLGVMKEHLHTREKAGFFDVSHMGQVVLIGRRRDAAEA
ncbi:MAG: hypothetical protein VXZ18_10105, partial [Pseudomonadota bacterium]|nr:hypothetical protein [Pseudomonadota bacterium]